MTYSLFYACKTTDTSSSKITKIWKVILCFIFQMVCGTICLNGVDGFAPVGTICRNNEISIGS